MNEALGIPVRGADAAPFWDGTSRRSLELQHCTACRKPRFPPSLLCPACHSPGAEWLPCSGGGRVYSFTIVRRAPGSAWRERVPYVIVLIDLAEGVRLMANILGPDALDVAIGAPVEVDFEARGPLTVPQFRLSGPVHGQ